MSRLMKFSLSVFIAFTILFAQGCSVIPQGIKNIFASKTPTPTNTPTSTPTPTATATPTKTPMPPVLLYDCVFIDWCPEAIPVDVLSEAEDETAGRNLIEFSYDQPIQFIVGWMARDESLLQDKLEHINWIFTIDGQRYFREDWLEPGEAPDEFNVSVARPGMWFGVVMGNWEIGESHEVNIGYILDAEVYNGWETFPANTSYLARYLLQPKALPTATPTATATRTRVPITNTPKPPPPPACEANASILIENNTGGWISIYLTGPAKFNFDLPAGNQTINVCPGQYSYTAYGCGGSSKNGSINANSSEGIELWCE